MQHTTMKKISSAVLIIGLSVALPAFAQQPGGAGTENLVSRANSDPVNIPLMATAGEAKGFVVARNLGLVDSLEVFLYKLKPQTAYNVYVSGQGAPVASFRTNPMGMANGTAIGPMREIVSSLSSKSPAASSIYVVEAGQPADPAKAVLTNAQ